MSGPSPTRTRAIAADRSHTRRRSTLLARALWIALAALMIALAACGPADADAAIDGAATDHGHGAATADHSAMGHGTDHAGMDPAAMDHTALDAAEPSDFSIYHLDSTWLDRTGAARPLESLAGRVQVVALLYTRCAYACPRIMLDMKRIEGELAPELRDDVGFVVVSIDPERDTPERLAEFAAGSRLDPDRWTLLTADEGDILELAAVLGVQYRQTAPGEWVHSNLITVLNPEGEVAHRQLGLGTDPAATLAAIERIAR